MGGCEERVLGFFFLTFAFFVRVFRAAEGSLRGCDALLRAAHSSRGFSTNLCAHCTTTNSPLIEQD